MAIIVDIKIALEWDAQSGLSLSNIYPLREKIEEFFKDRFYGTSISRIGIVMTCMEIDTNQRKRYNKDKREFVFDIILDFFSIKNAPIEQKKEIIRIQMCEIAKETFSKYSFNDFDKPSFLSDFEKTVKSIEW
jgi:hypothetical protein